ncbi:MAG TPA: DUF4190 domain-containing protein [Acidimicrobiales bacterium]|nr:DUF4190 domain-containing protein [Acidimicrobiales bacterium]
MSAFNDNGGNGISVLCRQCGAPVAPGRAFCEHCAWAMNAAATAPPRRQANVNAIISIACGGSGLGCFPLGIAAIVLGRKARREIARSDGRQWGAELALAGMILGWVGLGMSLIWILQLVLVISSD